ncbi:hypothetical protein MTR_8g009750 [Medicago truncatula]|uniref:Uncharacterized protein n=1 Tax=Medicago truncatula TaxID=3880 RepID=A0A072TKG1_MEDTR|nr:hypothetical protein MTR_8g009750 [Medicago truncatula]
MESNSIHHNHFQYLSTHFNTLFFVTKLIQCPPLSQPQTSSLHLLLNTIHTSDTRLFNKLITSFPNTTLHSYAKICEIDVQP